MDAEQQERLRLKQGIMQEVLEAKTVFLGLQGKLKKITPMADQLVVSKDIEKAIRVIEKVQMGLGGIVV